MITLKDLGLIAVLIIVLLFSAQTTISLKPFSIKFENGYYTIGFLFILIGLLLAKYQGKVNATKEFFEEYEIIEETFDESNIQESQSNTPNV